MENGSTFSQGPGTFLMWQDVLMIICKVKELCYLIQIICTIIYLFFLTYQFDQYSNISDKSIVSQSRRKFVRNFPLISEYNLNFLRVADRLSVSLTQYTEGELGKLFSSSLAKLIA